MPPQQRIEGDDVGAQLVEPPVEAARLARLAPRVGHPAPLLPYEVKGRRVGQHAPEEGGGLGVQQDSDAEAGQGYEEEQPRSFAARVRVESGISTPTRVPMTRISP